MAWQSILKPRQGNGRQDLDHFFDLSGELLAITTLEGRFIRVDRAFVQTLGHAEPDLLAMSISDLLHPADRETTESRFRCADGSYKWIGWTSTPFPAEGFACFVGRDRTEWRQREDALRQSELRCSCALEGTTDAYFEVDREWRLVRVNRQAETLWMRSRDQLLGCNLWELFPEAVGGPFHGMYEQVVRTGEPAQLEEYYPHAPLDRWFKAHAYALPGGLAVFFRDVTERRHAQEKIRRSLQEKEVLLREVHHRVKNNLQVICSMLRLQSRSLQDETLLQVLRDCRERVLAMALLHDQLHRAKDLSNINLGEYIRNLAASLFCSYGINSADIDLKTDVADIIVTIDIAIPCGLIVNELMSNSLRHAFPSGKGSIWLELRTAGEGRAELVIRDDGQGFPKEPRSSQSRSLGLWLVDLLTEQMDGAMKRSSEAGTAYRLLFQTTELRKDESDEQTSDHVGRG